jgi:hypothetical protein
VSWSDDTAAAIDLYYDPVVDEHVGHGPMGLIAPGWYLAPQRREVAEAGWMSGATMTGVLGDSEIAGLDSPDAGVMLVQLAGEFADPAVTARLWDAADQFFEPTWNHDTGEFTLGFGLNESHPRGQLNARAMAGWVCREGAWSRVFNQPNLAKFDEPTVSGVDFPRVALSQAWWDGSSLRLAAQPQNATARESRTSVRITGLPSGDWQVVHPDLTTVPLRTAAGTARAELVADNELVRIDPKLSRGTV